MSVMSSVDQQIWKKVNASKSKIMSIQQIEAAVPTFAPKAVASSVNALVKLRLLSLLKGKDDVPMYKANSLEEAQQKSNLSREQKIVMSVVEGAGNRGISSASVGRAIGAETMPIATVRKILKGLETDGYLNSFKPINALTTVLYVLDGTVLPEDLAGGVWYDNKKEYDESFVDSMRSAIGERVLALTYVPDPADPENAGQALYTQRKLIPHGKHDRHLTPEALCQWINNSKLTAVKLSVKNVMELLRALELDGMVEMVKPLGGVGFLGGGGYSSEEEDRPREKRRKVADSDDELDDDERERRRRKEKEKEKARMKEKKRKERQKEKEKKEKEKERKLKEKEKEKKRKEKEREKRKENEREKKRKEKEKKKKKKHDGSDMDDSDDDMLVSIDDASSKKKSKKRSRSLSISSLSSSSSSSSSSGSSSLSDSDSGSDSDSSVASSQIDHERIHRKQKSTAAAAASAARLPANDPAAQATATHFPGGLGGGLTDLSDLAVIYRATGRLTVPLGQTQAPCGKCPVFAFCGEGGPVEAEGCEFVADWLVDGSGKGGWDAEAQQIMRPEIFGKPGEKVEGVEGVEGVEAGKGTRGKRVNGVNGDAHEMDVDDF